MQRWINLIIISRSLIMRNHVDTEFLCATLTPGVHTRADNEELIAAHVSPGINYS